MKTVLQRELGLPHEPRNDAKHAGARAGAPMLFMAAIKQRGPHIVIAGSNHLKRLLPCFTDCRYLEFHVSDFEGGKKRV
jgi:hypothetical protein